MKRHEDSGFETRSVRTKMDQSNFHEHSSPIYPTSSFTFESAEEARALFAGEADGMIYSRYSNPNTDEFVAKLCSLEGADDGIATASGMSAVFAALAGLLSSGDHVVAVRAVFGSTHQILTRILPRWGISCTYVDASDPSAWPGAFSAATKMVIFETPSNPGLEIVDIRRMADIAHSQGVPVCVDNCFATPYLQRPLEHGADIVTHSATKFLDGQGRVLGGAVLGRAEHLEDIRFFARQSGPALSPFHAWILAKSMETLGPRMDRHCENAERLARLLEGHSGVKQVRYPALQSHPQHDLAMKQMSAGGGVISFELDGGLAAGSSFLNQLKMISRSANLGDSRSIATHPASTTHAKLSQEERQRVGISDGLVRISVGLESFDDIASDVRAAIPN